MAGRGAPPARQSMRERMREQAEKAQFGGASYIKIPEGKKAVWFSPKDKADGYVLDFLPYEVSIPNHPAGMKPGDLWSRKAYKVHFKIGSAEQSYVCPRTINKPCPICEDRSALGSDPNLTKADEKIVEDLRPKDRTLFQLIDLEDDKNKDVIQLWDYSFHLFEKRLLSDILKTENAAPGRKRSTAHGGYADLSGGQTLTLSFVKKANPGFNAFYDCDRIDAQDREDYDEEILDEVFDLDTILEILPYDKLKQIHLGLDEEHSSAIEQPAGRRRGAPPAEEPEPEAQPIGRRARGTTTPPAEEPEAQPTGRRARGTTTPAEEPEPQPTGRRGRATPPPEQESEQASRPSRPSRGAASNTPECIAGGTFGVDLNAHDKCYDCPDDTWKACQEANLSVKK